MAKITKKEFLKKQSQEAADEILCGIEDKIDYWVDKIIYINI